MIVLNNCKVFISNRLIFFFILKSNESKTLKAGNVAIRFTNFYGKGYKNPEKYKCIYLEIKKNKCTKYNLMAVQSKKYRQGEIPI